MANVNKLAYLIGACVFALLAGCTTYREAKPAVAAEPPKAYEQKTPDEMRDQGAVEAESSAEEEAAKKKKKAASDAQ